MLGKSILVFFLVVFFFLLAGAVGGLDLLTGGRIESFQILSIAILKVVRERLEVLLPAKVLSVLTVLGAVVSDLLVFIFLILDVVRLVLFVPLAAVWYSSQFVYLVVRYGYIAAVAKRLQGVEMALLKKGRFTLPPLTRSGKGILVFAPYLLTVEVEDDVVKFETIPLNKFYLTKHLLGGDFVLFERAAVAASSPELRSASQEQLIFEAVDQPPTKTPGKPRRQVGL